MPRHSPASGLPRAAQGESPRPLARPRSYTESTPLWRSAGPTQDARTVTEVGTNTRFVHVALLGTQLQSSGPELSQRQPRVRTSTTARPPQLLLLSEEDEGQLGALPPRLCVLWEPPGTCRASEGTWQAAWDQGELRPRERALRPPSGSGSSVAAATTVPTRVGVLAVPKLGPPAQDLVGAVLPTATGHAGGGVIDLKPAAGEKGGTK